MANRKYHELQFIPEQLHIYAIKIQCWYRGSKTRAFYKENKPDLIKARYRRSICAYCHTKASVKRCLLCQADFCFGCFQSIHITVKGNHLFS